MNSKMRIEADVNHHEDMTPEAKQQHESLVACVELMLLGAGNKTCVYSDQSCDAEDVLQYNDNEFVFKIVVDGDYEDANSVREGFEVTLCEELGEEYGVEFDIEHLQGDDYRVIMTETEDTVYV